MPIHFLADCHVGHAIRKTDPLFARWSELAFLNTCESLAKSIKCYKNDTNVVIFAGDTTELPHIEGGALMALERGLRMIKDAGGSILYIDGNHDRQSHNRPGILNTFGCGLLTCDGINYEFGDKSIRFCGFSNRPGEELHEHLDAWA